MRNFVILTSYGPWQYNTINTLISRNCIPKAVIFEGPIRDTFIERCVRFIESFFLWVEHNVYFRRHIAVHDRYRRHGSLIALLTQYDIPWYSVENHNDAQSETLLKEISPVYMLLCGTRMLKEHILAIPTKGTLNAHSAMLPEFRGAKSEYWLLSEKKHDAAGVTVHWVDSNLDTGEICVQEHITVAPHETTKTLRAKALYLAAHLFAETLRRLESGEELHIQQGQGKLYKRPPFTDIQKFD